MDLLVEVNELARKKQIMQGQQPPRAADYEVRIRGREKNPFDQRRAEELKEKINDLLVGREPFTAEPTGKKIRRFRTIEDIREIGSFTVQGISRTDQVHFPGQVSEQAFEKFQRKLRTRIHASDRAPQMDEYVVVRQFHRDPGAARKMAEWLKKLLQQEGHIVETRGTGRPGE